MKVTTEDCVNAIIKYFKQTDISDESPLLDAKQWKRLSKSGKGDSIVRVFRNTKTTDMINVTSSEHEILSVDKYNTNVSNFKTFVTTQKNMKCTCEYCGTTNIKLHIYSTEGEDIYDIKPTKLNQKKAQKIIDNNYGSIWLCYGRCEDETSAVVEIDGKKIKNPDDFIKYITDNGNPKIDDIDSITVNKNIDIIQAVKIGDLEQVKKYIDAGNNLDSYIGDLPENKNMSGISETNWTLLQYAIDEQQWDVAIALINGGCDVNKNMRHLKTNAIITILQNKWRSPKIYDVIDALMTHGGDLSFKSYNGEDIFDSAWGSKKKHKQYIIDNYPELYKEYLSKK